MARRSQQSLLRQVAHHSCQIGAVRKTSAVSRYRCGNPDGEYDLVDDSDTRLNRQMVPQLTHIQAYTTLLT
jgi:hypothetical protein